MSKPLRRIPLWAWLSLLANGVLISAVLLLLRSPFPSPDSIGQPLAWERVDGATMAQLPEASYEQVTAEAGVARAVTAQDPPALGSRHQLHYEEWLAILQQEANAVAQQKPHHLAVLAGDSLSLWFPSQELPLGYTWLNQGISGEVSEGLLNRLNVFDGVPADVVFVMIGINDLLREVPADRIVRNQLQIINRLKQAHPSATIVVQSILPHGGEQATWEGRDRLLAISNQKILSLNQRLAELSKQEKVHYLDLYPLFTDSQGYLNPDLTTDGLHLNAKGYLVWRTALQMFSQLELEAQFASREGAKPPSRAHLQELLLQSQSQSSLANPSQGYP